VVNSFYLNGLVVEIRHEESWEDSSIYIYDCLSNLSKAEQKAMVEYLYNEGLIEDRRIRTEVVRGEDMN
tara:strand:+ start:342 stop:548 length:207 start_codon:yes stop_codon:yes gene_type:complete